VEDSTSVNAIENVENKMASFAMLLMALATLASGDAAPNVTAILPGLYPNELSFTPASQYQPYVSYNSDTSNASTWFQVDLGDNVPTIQTLSLYPLVVIHEPSSNAPYPSSAWPGRYKIETDTDPAFSNPILLVDRTDAEQPNPFDTIVNMTLTSQSSSSVSRYVRFTATELGLCTDGQHYCLGMMKFGVVADSGEDVAVGKAVTVDSTLGNTALTQQLTRPPRPMGEGVVTDYPENEIDPTTWNRPQLKAFTPKSGVTVGTGLFQTAMMDNIGYLLNESMGTVDKLVEDFLVRSGKAPANLTYPPGYWTDFPGSNAARFLMGASNTLRWIEHSELRDHLESVLSTIEDCAEDDGYIMAYAPEEMFIAENAAYVRSWVTHGLIDTGYLGYQKAFDLLRGYYDWWEKYPYLDRILLGTVQGGQGVVANTLVARSPIGRPSDVTVTQRYLQQNFWRDGLAKQDPNMIWQYPYDRPHTYLSTDLEPYIDMYLLTGDQRYHDMVLGYWNLFMDNWIQIGGSTAIVEYGDYPPKSYKINPEDDVGELCGNSFWIRINQRLHWLDPDNEAYVNQIEKSIYNVVLANQINDTDIVYHAHFYGTKDFGFTSPAEVPVNTCCEGQGTRTLGSLPEFIFSTAADGIYVNLFDTASITWTLGGQAVTLSMVTSWPYDTHVHLTVTSMKQPTNANIRIRVPSWAASPMELSINGDEQVTGQSGAFANLSRTWKAGDEVTFSLPAEYHMTQYVGVDQVAGHQRYALEYGPILMAATGPDEWVELNVTSSSKGAEGLIDQLRPIAGQPLHSTIDGADGYVYMPYFEVGRQTFTTLPVVDVVG
jgi:DUF1680 family protein